MRQVAPGEASVSVGFGDNSKTGLRQERVGKQSGGALIRPHKQKAPGAPVAASASQT